MPVLSLSLQEEEDDVLGAAQQLLAKFKISWHLYFFQNLKKVKSRGKGRQTCFDFFFYRIVFKDQEGLKKCSLLKISKMGA